METKQISIRNLTLDRTNYRTVPQRDEAAAVHAMIALKPEYFWGLAESLLADGFLPTESIIVLKDGKDYIVKEGNRRIGALKIIHGFLQIKGLDIPEEIKTKLCSIDAEWKQKNAFVPCTVFEKSEADLADRIVDLVHGKSEKAARLDWNSVARARHNRDRNNRVELGLDLLEKYLKKGRNLTPQQKEAWASDYSLTILNDVLPRLATAAGMPANKLVEKYPDVENRNGLENLLRDIGMAVLKFQNIRSAEFGPTYGFKPAPQAPLANPISGTSILGNSPSTTQTPGTVPSYMPGGIQKPISAGPKTAAAPLNEPKSVSRKLRTFAPKGKTRDKLVSLLVEIKKLKIRDHPLSFCFLLRAMFEVSAKAYATDHNISLVDKGKDRRLADVLKDIGKHLTNNFDAQHSLTKPVQAALMELAAKNELLSITSLNFLVHSPTFSLDERHICTRFHNVYPLLQEMNR